jgi:hypothetical protein
MDSSNTPRRVLLRLAAASLPLLAACGDRSGSPAAVPDGDVPLPRSTVAALRCTASVAHPSLACEDLPLTGVGSKSGAGPRMNLRVLGGQGTYVRLTSASPGYNAGTQVFSFTVTVQDLATLALATADGATRDNKGVQVFFSAPPAATGGTGTITVANPTGQGTFTNTNQDYFQYGGQLGGVDQPELGADGILSTGEVSSARSWQLNIPNTVTTFSFVLYVSTEMPPGSVVTAAPQVTAVSPNPLVPGAAATLTGINFNATPASNTVSIGGQVAAVTGGSTTSLTVTVPCTSSGSVPVYVTQGGMRGATYSHPLQVTQRTVGVGQALVLTDAASSYCNELTSAGGAARYEVAVFSASTSTTSNSPFQLSADGEGAPAAALRAAPATDPPLQAAPPSLDGQMAAARQRAADDRHFQLLEANRAEYVRLRAHFGTHVAPRARISRDVVNGDPPLTRTFRVANINVGGLCNSYYVVSATRVYYNGKLAIYEDDATPDAFKSSLNATMAANYQKIGDQFNADMEPIVRNNFGDILRRDAETDNNGIEIALFTPRINTSFANVAGFVVGCDQFPNDDAGTPAVGGPYTGTGTNGSSNFGEFFYAYQPVTAGSGYGGNTADNWYRTIRSTFIHESKHIASQAARVANNAPTFEASWLEEGTARHAEELWMRNAVDNVAWKGNTGYGSFATPVNVYCDARPGFAECDANPRRPASIMQRHFTSLYTNMFGTNARLLSPFGATASDNASYFYATSWSLVRYAIDRYGTSDAAFLTALTNSTTSSVTNLTARAGVSIDQLLGGWALSFYADDYPGLGAPSPDIQMPTWNFRSIYAGLNTDFPATYTLTYPLVPQARSFGTFAPVAVATLRGGGVLWYEISGTQTAPQLLRLEASGGGAPSSTLRIAVTRLQ